MTERYKVKRRAGISDVRYDGSKTSPETDRQSSAAERFAAESLGCRFNDSITVHGDCGHDFEFVVTVEVIWLGFVKGTGKPRSAGHLIVNPEEPHRWADIYVAASGCIEDGFILVGWTTHAKLESYGMKDFGFGYKMAMPTRELYPIASLMSLSRKVARNA